MSDRRPPRAKGTGSAPRQRADGRWEARYTVDRVQRSVYGRTSAEARRKRDDALRAVAAGELARAPARLTVGEHLTTWLEELVRPHRKAITYARREAIVRLHLVPAFGDRPLVKLTRLEIQSWVNRQMRQYAPNTVLAQHAALAAALRAAVDWELLARNPATGVQLPTRPRSAETILDEDSASRFLDSLAGHRHESLFVVALTTGLRVGELLALRWSDLDLDAGLLHVRRTVARVNRAFVEGPPKSTAGVRTVELATSVVAVLRAHRTRQAAERLAAPAWPRPDLLFVSQTGRQFHARHVSSWWLPRLLARAGLPRLTIHQLGRHGCASWMLARGERVEVVSRMLGHANIAITLNLYRHLLPDEQRGATERLADRLLNGRMKGQSN